MQQEAAAHEPAAQPEARRAQQALQSEEREAERPADVDVEHVAGAKRGDHDDREEERKLRALKREFQLLREQGRDTPADRRESDGRVARQAELLGQVEEAESTLAAEEQYHAVLESMLYARRSALDHATEELEDLRGWLKSFGRQREKLSRMGAELRYASWRERNSATLGREVFGQLHEIRSGLRSRRRELLVAEEMARAQEAEADEAAAAEARREEAEGELKGEVNRRITVARVQNAKERARRMEVQFARLQQLAGLGRIDEVVERCIAQGQARAPMAPRDQPAFHSRIRSNRAGKRADARDPRRRDAQTASARRREGADGGGV